MVFTAFVCMQLFNQCNARKSGDERGSVLAGALGNKLFLGILGAEALLLFLVVTFGGAVFDTTPLNLEQWGACVGVGAIGLIVRHLLAAVSPHSRGVAGEGEGEVEALIFFFFFLFFYFFCSS